MKDDQSDASALYAKVTSSEKWPNQSTKVLRTFFGGGFHAVERHSGGYGIIT